ncbi:MAG TPA: flagellar hook protein FlgE [Terriglobia bacterium]|nr:flagellar hook protein FlgE [Terriglobia bacterium]
MASFSTPLSGLLANNQALSVVSNNLANLSTDGFKGETPLFQDLFYQQYGINGAGDPIQVGVGTNMNSDPTNFSQGTISNTGVSTDMAIQGDGFFQVQKGDVTLYTRDGNMTINAQGYLVTQDGAQVLGYPATNGVVSNNGPLSPLQLSGTVISPPKSTANVQLTVNLNASSAVNATYSTPVTVYDSLGTSHVLTLTFTKNAANSWGYSMTIPAADVGQSGNPVQVASGTLTFNGAGVLTSPASNVNGIQITGLADGANTLTFNWDLYNSNNAGLITQVAAPSSTTATQQDGFASGSLTGFNIQADGTVEGTFSNGQTMALGQVALATFPNNQGLLRTGSNQFMASLASGLPSVGIPGTGGRGTIADGALEGSNVDIATQFAQLIATQSAYQADARAITTANQFVQTALNLIPIP